MAEPPDIIEISELDELEPLPFPESSWGVPWIPFGLEDDQWLAPTFYRSGLALDRLSNPI